MSYKELDKNGRYRLWNVLLWTDNEAHMSALEYIKENYYYAACLQDKDVYLEDDELHAKGELKKPHYHIVIRFTNARWRSALAKEWGIEERWLEPTGNFYKSAEYLIHFGKQEKYQYDIEELFGPMAPEVAKIIDDVPMEVKYQCVIDMIERVHRVYPIRNLQRDCLACGYWSVIRGCYKQILDYLNEHNLMYREIENK